MTGAYYLVIGDLLLISIYIKTRYHKLWNNVGRERILLGKGRWPPHNEWNSIADTVRSQGWNGVDNVCI